MFTTFAAAFTQFSTKPATLPIMKEAIIPVANVPLPTVIVLPIDFNAAKQVTISHATFDFGCLEGVGHVFSISHQANEEPSPIPTIVFSVHEGDEEDTISQVPEYDNALLHPEYVRKVRCDGLKRKTKAKTETKTETQTETKAATASVWEDDSDDEDDDDDSDYSMDTDLCDLTATSIPAITVSMFQDDKQDTTTIWTRTKYDDEYLTPPEPMYKKSQRLRHQSKTKLNNKIKTTAVAKVIDQAPTSTSPTPSKAITHIPSSFLFDLPLPNNALFGSSRQRKTKATRLGSRTPFAGRSATFF